MTSPVAQIVVMQPETESPVGTKETTTIGQRLAGVFFGGITGLVLSVLLLLLLDISGVISGTSNGLLARFVCCGIIPGGILGTIFPRPLIAIGSILGNLIPGF